MSVNINNEELKTCLLKGCESTFINKEDVVLEVFDRFFFEKEDLTDTLQHPTKWWKTYDVGTLHEVSGRISFMWLTEDGRAIRSDRGSHFTILNWALYNYLKDNCATRVADIIINNTKNKFKDDKLKSETNLSYRDLIRGKINENSWAALGIDLCLGAIIDKKINTRETFFLPENLMKYLDSYDGDVIKRNIILSLNWVQKPVSDWLDIIYQ